MGSVEFASMVAALLGMSQGITLVLARFLLVFDYERSYYDEYAVGFSGVLFAMKVVLYSRSDSYAYVQGIMVPARYAAWAELVLIQMLVPGVSFLGHLGGILAGILYLYLARGSTPSSTSGANPNPFVKMMRGLLGWPLRFVNRLLGRTGRDFGRGTLHGTWSCGACTYHNSGLLSVCEICGTERGLAPMPDTTISPDQLRQRRVERFGRWSR